MAKVAIFMGDDASEEVLNASEDELREILNESHKFRPGTEVVEVRNRVWAMVIPNGCDAVAHLIAKGIGSDKCYCSEGTRVLVLDV